MPDIQQHRRLLQEAKRLREHQLREEKKLLRAASFAQAAFRRRTQRRWLEAQAQQQRARDAPSTRTTAGICLQRAWRRHKADQTLDRRKRRQGEVAADITPAAQQKVSKEQPTSDDDPNGMGGSRNSLENDSRVRSAGEPSKNDEGASWQSWSSAFELNPALAAEIAREGKDTAGESARPWTAAGAVESSALKSSGQHPFHPQPPAGMMTVTVRRGSEETSLVTPIVLTENGEEEQGTTATPPPNDESPTGDVMGAAHPGSLGKRGEVGESLPVEASPTDAEEEAGVKGPSPVDGGGPAVADSHADTPVADRAATGEREQRLGGSAEVTAPTSDTISSFPAITTRSIKSADIGISLPSSSTAVAIANNNAAKTSLANQSRTRAATLPAAKAVACQPGLPAAGAAQVTDPGHRVSSRTVVRPKEQLFMEDTQVYLGCAACGVKYLVEAVDPERAKSTQGGLERLFCLMLVPPSVLRSIHNPRKAWWGWLSGS